MRRVYGSRTRAFKSALSKPECKKFPPSLRAIPVARLHKRPDKQRRPLHRRRPRSTPIMTPERLAPKSRPDTLTGTLTV